MLRTGILRALCPEKGNGVVRRVRLEQVGVFATQPSQLLLEEVLKILPRDQADVQVAGDVTVGPNAENCTPGSRFHVLDDDAQVGHALEKRPHRSQEAAAL